MTTLEPLCTGEQTIMLQQLGLNVLIDPTISLAKNWLYNKYGLWMETCHHETSNFVSRVWLKDLVYPIFKTNPNPHTAESDCLTEVLKKLTSNKPTD